MLLVPLLLLLPNLLLWRLVLGWPSSQGCSRLALLAAFLWATPPTGDHVEHLHGYAPYCMQACKAAIWRGPAVVLWP
jgi:hypothetical protein